MVFFEGRKRAKKVGKIVSNAAPKPRPAHYYDNVLGEEMSPEEREIREQFQSGFNGQKLTPQKAGTIMKGFFGFAILAAGAILLLGRK